MMGLHKFPVHVSFLHQFICQVEAAKTGCPAGSRPGAGSSGEGGEETEAEERERTLGSQQSFFLSCFMTNHLTAKSPGFNKVIIISTENQPDETSRISRFRTPKLPWEFK